MQFELCVYTGLLFMFRMLLEHSFVMLVGDLQKKILNNTKDKILTYVIHSIH